MNVRISLPEEIVAKYEQRPGELESNVARNVVQFADVHSVKPLVIEDADRRALETALGRNLNTTADLVRAVTTAAQLSIDGVDVALGPYLLSRLKTRCIGVEWKQFVNVTVKRLLEEFVGLR